MPGQQPIELVAHRPKRARLDLHQEAGATKVDDETLERHLEFIARLGVALLQCGMKRPFVEGPDLGSGVDGMIVAPSVPRPPPESRFTVFADGCAAGVRNAS